MPRFWSDSVARVKGCNNPNFWRELESDEIDDSVALPRPPLDDEVSPLYIAKFAHSLQEAARCSEWPYYCATDHAEKYAPLTFTPMPRGGYPSGVPGTRKGTWGQGRPFWP